MHKLLPILFFTLLSCTENAVSEKTTSTTNSSTSVSSLAENQQSVALKFINGYVENANLMGKAIETRKWVAQNPLVTESFKKAVTKLIDDAEKADPELGLDFDPIFDAQDYPEEGFALEKADEKTGFVTVVGKKWTDFRLKLRLVQVNGNWLVDGAGVVNIQAKQRATR